MKLKQRKSYGRLLQIGLAALIGLATLSGKARAQSVLTRQNAFWTGANTTTLNKTLGASIKLGDTVVVVVAFINSANVGHVTCSGLGATWTQGFNPPMAQGNALNFCYGTNASTNNTTLTITVPFPDTLTVSFQEWTNLNAIEDPGSQTEADGIGTAITTTSVTSNPNDVVISAASFGGTSPSVSPPQSNFRPVLAPQNTTPPFMAPAYTVVGSAGTYTNSFVLSKSAGWQSVSVALKSKGAPAALFSATPLIDYTGSQLYLGKFPGFLYDGSNTMSAAHDADGRSFAAQVQPLDGNGNPSAIGKIGVVGMGMSNWTEELCTGNVKGLTKCDPYTFSDQIKKTSGLNPNMVLVDCAQGNAFPNTWTNPSSTQWTTCLNNLSSVYGLTPAQVQVVLWKNADNIVSFNTQLVGLSKLPGTTCPSNPNPSTDPDACVYEQQTAMAARVAKSQFPNLKQMFLHSRIYGGYAGASSPHTEPFSYEGGFGTKWLIAAQVNQIATGTVDPLAGDLSYGTAPWLAWGPYFWANANAPRSDGISWLGGDIQNDGVHASYCGFYGENCGRRKVANILMSFYTTSVYAPWFLAAP